MSEALRFNNDKPMMSYFMRSFPKMAEAVARVKEMGAIKYNDGNWRLGNKPDGEYWDSMFRHLTYIFGGEDYDKDTGCLHIAHAVWNMCALLELNYPDLPARDDEIWAERAVHWAEEKKKREADNADESTEANTVARWAEKKRKGTPATAATEMPKPCPASTTFSPVFTAFIEKLAICDKKIEAQYAAHCAEEKKREAKATPETVESDGEDVLLDIEFDSDFRDSMLYVGVFDGLTEDEVYDELFGPEVDLTSTSRTEEQESIGTVEREACWAADAARRERDAEAAEPAEDRHWTTFVVKRGGEAYCVPPCPVCGHSSDILLNGEKGMECPDCGEIFEVPIGPEEFVISPGSKSVGVIIRDADEAEVERRNDAALYAAGNNDAVDAINDLEATTKRIVEDLLSKERQKDFDAVEGFADTLAARWAREEKRAWEASDKIVQRDDAADAATYAGGFNIHSWNIVSHQEDCPQCGYCSVALKGRDGKECTACGEIFGLPIVPENPPGLKPPRFIIRDAKPSSSFKALMDKIFKINLGRK